MRTFLGLGLVATLSGCLLLDGGGGPGGGTGGGTGSASFVRGFVYVGPDDRNIYVSDETDNFALSVKLTTEGGASFPSLSSDGKKVVYVRKNGSVSELVTVLTAGGTSNRVFTSTVTEKNLRTPIFSKDGAKVIFTYDVGVTSALGIVNIDGTGFVTLVGGGVNPLAYASPTLYPDGLSVLAMAGNSVSSYTQLAKVTLATGEPTPIANDFGLEAFSIANRVVISPDGTQAAFDSVVSSSVSRVFVINLGSKQVTTLTDHMGEVANDAFPTWVGNTKVGFTSDSGQSDKIYALTASLVKTSGGLQLASGTEPWFGP
jgi:TolB protein